MMNPNEMYGYWSNMNKMTFQPFLEWNNLFLKLAERATQQQLEVISDYLSTGIKQCQTFGNVRKMEDFLKAQSEISTEMGKKTMQTAQNNLNLFMESTEATREWAEKTMSRASRQGMGVGGEESSKTSGGRQKTA